MDHQRTEDKTIVFELRADTAKSEVGAALKEICSITELFNVRAVFPDDTGSNGFIYTANVQPAAAEKALKAVAAAPYVEYAHVAPERTAFRG